MKTFKSLAKSFAKSFGNVWIWIFVILILITVMIFAVNYKEGVTSLESVADAANNSATGNDQAFLQAVEKMNEQLVNNTYVNNTYDKDLVDNMMFASFNVNPIYATPDFIYVYVAVSTINPYMKTYNNDIAKAAVPPSKYAVNKAAVNTAKKFINYKTAYDFNKAVAAFNKAVADVGTKGNTIDFLNHYLSNITFNYDVRECAKDVATDMSHVTKNNTTAAITAITALYSLYINTVAAAAAQAAAISGSQAAHQAAINAGVAAATYHNKTAYYAKNTTNDAATAAKNSTYQAALTNNSAPDFYTAAYTNLVNAYTNQKGTYEATIGIFIANQAYLYILQNANSTNKSTLSTITAYIKTALATNDVISSIVN